MDCVALKGRRLAKLSLAGVDDLLGMLGHVAGFVEELKAFCKAGVDLPEIGGVGRKAR